MEGGLGDIVSQQGGMKFNPSLLDRQIKEHNHGTPRPTAVSA